MNKGFDGTIVELCIYSILILVILLVQFWLVVRSRCQCLRTVKRVLSLLSYTYSFSCPKSQWFAKISLGIFLSLVTLPQITVELVSCNSCLDPISLSSAYFKKFKKKSRKRKYFFKNRLWSVAIRSNKNIEQYNLWSLQVYTTSIS